MALKRVARWIATAFSTLIVIEVLIMISPFALYWYSVYTPALQGMYRTRWTAWMESFFLPHSVVTNSAFLEFLRWKVGPYLFSLGLLAFLALAIQLYSAKLRKKGVVRGGIYRYVRHPQYLFLSIAGLGLLTLWPRMVILVFYLGMLIAYYLLARSEEGRMVRAHPGYAEYQERTVMFVPGSPGRHFRQWIFGWVKNPNVGIGLSLATLLVVGLGLGFVLRQYSISHVAQVTLPNERMVVFAAWPEDASRVDIPAFVEGILRDSATHERIQQQGEASFAVHLLPANYGMVNMFASNSPRGMNPQFTLARFRFVLRCLFPFIASGQQGVGRPLQKTFKVVLSRASKPGQDTIGFDQILDLGVKMTPVAMVEADAATGEILKREDPGAGSVWGPIAMPIF